MVLAAVKQSGMELKWASKRLQDDMEVALAAVQAENSRPYEAALEYVSPRLRQCRIVALAAVQKFGLSLRHLPEEQFVADKEMVLSAVCQNAEACDCRPQWLHLDDDVVLEAVRGGLDIARLSEKHCTDKENLLAYFRLQARLSRSLMMGKTSWRITLQILVISYDQTKILSRQRVLPLRVKLGPVCRQNYEKTAHLFWMLSRIPAQPFFDTCLNP